MGPEMTIDVSTEAIARHIDEMRCYRDTSVLEALAADRERLARELGDHKARLYADINSACLEISAERDATRRALKLADSLLADVKMERDRLASDLAQAKVDLGVEAEMRRAVEKERDEHAVEIERLRDAISHDPNVFVVFCRDGEHQRLILAAGDAEAKLGETVQDLGILFDAITDTDGAEAVPIAKRLLQSEKENLRLREALADGTVDRGLVGVIMDELWSEAGGNTQEADWWRDANKIVDIAVRIIRARAGLTQCP